MSLEIGSIIEGTVTNITSFGAFIELEGGKVGMVHISEIADGFIADIRPYLKEKQQIRVKVIGVNDKGKYELSLKQVNKAPANKTADDKKKIKVKSRTLIEVEREGTRRSESTSFEEKLARFMKESEERLLDLKRNVEAKRGKTGKR